MPMTASAPKTDPSPLLSAIETSDCEGLSNFFFTAAARAGGLVKIVPEGVAWDDYTFNRSLLVKPDNDPAETLDEALRWCVVFDGISECEADTAGLMYLDRQTGNVMLAALSGPAHDHAVAVRTIARDLGVQGFAAEGRPTLEVETVLAADKALPKAANDNQRPRFSVTWFGDITPDSVPRESVVKGVFGLNEFSSVSGLPGSGKSALVTDACCHVAAGKEWMGHKVKPGLVVYVAAERKLLTERRMLAFRKHHDIGERIPLVVIGGRLDLTSNLKDAADLVATIKSLETRSGKRCVWVVVDTLARTFGPGDQNKSQDMLKFVRACDHMRELLGGPHLTAIHHAGWGGERGKGAIDLDGAVDSSFMVKKSGSSFTFTCDGTNDGIDGLVCSFAMESVEVSVDEDGEPVAAPVIVKAEGKPIAMTLPLGGGTRHVVLQVLRDLCTDGSAAGGGMWLAKYRDSNPVKSDDAMKAAFYRARKLLLDQESVVKVEGDLWRPAA